MAADWIPPPAITTLLGVDMASVEAPLREFVGTRPRDKLIPDTGRAAAKHSAATKKAKEVTTLRTGAEWKPMKFCRAAEPEFLIFWRFLDSYQNKESVGVLAASTDA
jgi:hypothetical protein